MPVTTPTFNGSRFPTTGEVLAEIGAEGVITGSYALGKIEPKDLDMVVKADTTDGRNKVMARLFEKWPEYCESVIIGHCLVYASPLNVECFSLQLKTGEPEKDAKLRSFASARRRAVKEVHFGVECWIEKS